MYRARAFRRNKGQMETSSILPPQVYRSAMSPLHHFHHTLGNRVLGQLLSSEMGPLLNRPPQPEPTEPEKPQPEVEPEAEPVAETETATESAAPEVSPPSPPGAEREEETVVQAKHVSGAAPLRVGLSNARQPLIQRQPRGARRVEGTVSVSWIDDDVEFYHRVVNATAANRNFRGIETAGLWQPLHDPIFAMYRRLGLHRPALRAGQTVRLRVSVLFDPTVFHGQVTDGRVETDQAAQLRTATITGVLTARENFSGRSNTTFGLAEVVDLSFTATGATAASLGGLKWFVASGSGTVTGGNDGRGVFTAPATPDRVQLELRIASGLEAGRVVATNNIRVIQPSGAVMRKDSRAVKHTRNYWGVGFCGESFLRPTDVSFRALQIKEGRTTAVASGFLASRNGRVHPEGSWFDVLAGNSTTGCQIDSVDSVQTADLPGPFSDGDFLWRIPWIYRVGRSGAEVQFTIADQHSTSDSAGTATIQKIGSPVFSKAVGDATVDYPCY